MKPLWQQEQDLEYHDQRTTVVEWVVIAVGLVSLAAITAVAMWLW